MYIVTKEGYKLPVDDSSIPEDSYLRFQQTVGLYSDDTELRLVWIAEFNHKKYPTDENSELEYLGETVFRHKPSKEELLYAMSKNGCSRWDVVIIKEGYELDIGNGLMERVDVD